MQNEGDAPSDQSGRTSKTQDQAWALVAPTDDTATPSSCRCWGSRFCQMPRSSPSSSYAGNTQSPIPGMSHSTKRRRGTRPRDPG
ncbi:hypothetical protein DIPPA_20753 [Diplonema papillatum]|nr:hypothetical protein DIPPA_20753 [Diplonema papillatum]